MLFISLISRVFRLGLSNIESADSLVILWRLFTFAFKKSCKKQTKMKRILGLLMLLFSLQAFELPEVEVSCSKECTDGIGKCWRPHDVDPNYCQRSPDLDKYCTC